MSRTSGSDGLSRLRMIEVQAEVCLTGYSDEIYPIVSRTFSSDGAITAAYDRGIMLERVWITDSKAIKAVFLDFYKDKFSCHDSPVSFPSMLPANQLSIHDRDSLEVMISFNEIKTVVWDCGSQKAPGLDGYSFMFIKKFWELLDHDIHKFVVNFFSIGKFPQCSNSSFITLIPKVSNPLFIKDYIPISLISLHYKIIAKILANRLSKLIDSIISPEQSAFISDWKILNGPLILARSLIGTRNVKRN
uniref:Transposon TX1 uncharacterized n=1 Tax=Tanacetum cinerariifolium TaxID=118510 RepID=A0A6L2JPE0_TANCI|nr:transposon TX1 uncharacterized [Tanacetum cinerariifolium]